ncbi:putative flippase GtrA [Neobacillus niacini]|uniref:GtrA family protein n=1 Tax=Neobacillus driksii TaxID=3035913 RepID=UPI00278A6075|nr:GtrA family protein [Neobacillus niacini]MDQ0975134.1 putative flippase GtrA [Neobacillus niacini]
MEKRNEIVMYLLFGVLTTVINILCYVFLREYLHIKYILSTTIAWLISVVFAFLTNKKYVFKSNFTELNAVIQEFFSFTFFRVVSLGMDLGIMVVLVEIIKIDDFIAKIAANIVVVIMNYIVSKYVVFRTKRVNE